MCDDSHDYGSAIIARARPLKKKQGVRTMTPSPDPHPLPLHSVLHTASLHRLRRAGFRGPRVDCFIRRRQQQRSKSLTSCLVPGTKQYYSSYYVAFVCSPPVLKRSGYVCGLVRAYRPQSVSNQRPRRFLDIDPEVWHTCFYKPLPARYRS